MNLEEQRVWILSGKMYNDLTPELIGARERAVFLTNEYNYRISICIRRWRKSDNH